MIKLKPFQQSTGYCGPAVLKMILDFYGVKKTEKELVKLSGATREHGVEAPALLRAAKKLGFKGFIKDFSSLEDIKKYIHKNIPVIVDWFSVDDGHYSVVVGMDKKFIYLNDPELGRVRKLELKVFKRVWFDYKSDFPVSPRDFIIRRMMVIYS